MEAVARAGCLKPGISGFLRLVNKPRAKTMLGSFCCAPTH